MSNNIPSTQAEINGYTWTIYSDTTAETIAQIVKVSKALAKSGYSAPKKWSGGGFGGKKDNLVDAAFDGAGNEVCPIHKKPIREYKTQDGRTFKGCPSASTGAAGEQVNQRGYCALRFR